MSSKKKILFFYCHDLHHIFHSLYLAIELSNIQKEYEVYILNTSIQGHKIIKNELIKIENNIKYFYKFRHIIALDKKYKTILKFYKNFIKKFDIIITSAIGIPKILETLNLRNNFIIYTKHGLGDRKRTYDKRLLDFDCVFLPSKRLYDQFKSYHLIKKLKKYIVVEYTKFDYLEHHKTDKALQLFNNNPPTILYNPHHQKDISSIYKNGNEIIKRITNSKKYNLIIAPHPLIKRRYFLKRKILNVKKSNKVVLDWGSIHSINFD